MLSIFLIWIMDRWMNRWKQQQNIYRVMKPEEGKTLNKRHAWNVWEAWFHGHPPFLFLYLVCFSPPFIPHLSLPLSPIPFPLRGSSVWLFIGNDSHCGRAPLRLRSPPHPSILPPRSVPSAMHYSWLHNQMRELRLVAGDMVHGSSSPKVPWGAPVWYPPSPTPPNPRSGPTCHLPLTPSDTVTDHFFFWLGWGSRHIDSIPPFPGVIGSHAGQWWPPLPFGVLITSSSSPQGCTQSVWHLFLEGGWMGRLCLG